jgi:hypothetical protein
MVGIMAVWGLNILGNNFVESIGEHTIRLSTGEDVLISNNFIGPAPEGKHSLQLRDFPLECGDTGKPFSERATNHYLIQANLLDCGASYCIEGTKSTCEGDGQLPQNDLIIEKNFFREAPGKDQMAQGVLLSALNGGPWERAVIRNNVMNQTGWKWGAAFHGDDGVDIHNNTCFRSDSGSDTSAICVTPGGSDRCYNNVMFAPSWGGVVGWRRSSDSACGYEDGNMDDGTVANNITQSGSQLFDTWPPTDMSEAVPLVGSELRGEVSPTVSVNVDSLYDDGLGNCRDAATDAGAGEYGATDCNP